MNVHFKVEAKIGKVCDTKSSRYDLSNIQVTPTEGGVFLAATNGKAAAIRFAKGEADDEALCPSNALPDGKNGSVRLAGDRWENNKRQFVPLAEESSFPRIEEVMPEATASGHVVLGIDANLLAAVAEAASDPYDRSRQVYLLIPPADRGIVLNAVPIVGYNGNVGVIMPLCAKSGTVDSIFSKYESTRKQFQIARESIAK